MRKYSHIILCFLFALHLVPIHASAEEYDLMINGAKNEEEMYILLMEHKGHEILEEYIMLENEGASELIPYACALADKSDEFTEEEKKILKKYYAEVPCQYYGQIKFMNLLAVHLM